ncbi:MAG: hypothetical protein WAL71_12490 [Terriglobales bacterium]|jgi:type IV secretory pathway VirB10-like protein
MRPGLEIMAAAALICLCVVLSVGQDAPSQAPSAPEIQKAPEAPDAAPAVQGSPATPEDRSSEVKPGNGNDASKTEAKPDDKTSDKPKPHGKPRARHPATAMSSPSTTEPRKVVVRRGGASEPTAQIVTGMTPQEASAQRQEAEKSLDAAEENLKRLLGRLLDSQQEETVSQVHNYIGRARSALKEGDISRGHTLAVKANLLADDLVKY